MTLDLQTTLTLIIVLAAALYVTRTLWLRQEKKPGCDACPQSRNRSDDYV